MAYQYDQMGNIIGEYESDEERRRRLDAEAAQQPVKQTTTYNPDGTQEVTIRGTPQALSSANPNTPTVTGPVSPDDTFRRMQQVESGNRDFDAQGRPVTSPAGAMFRNQVMPATAAAPGFGIRPAQAQTPEEYNRVGQEYYQAMLKKFGGDTQKAAAAYNAGPGRVQQNMQANAGQMNVQQLPRETQGYLQKIGQTVSNMIPSAQAATLPPAAPVAPTAMPQAAPSARPLSTFQGQTNEFGGMESPRAPSSYVLGTQMGNQGIRIPGLTPVGQMPAPVDQTTQAITRYQSIQDNPEELMKLGFSSDAAVPDFLRERAKGRTAELITQQREMAVAREQIPTMSESDIATALRKKTTEGSYIKAALFSMLGMNVSAEAEAAKLGIGRETFVTVNGQPAMVKMAANGTPIEGYNATTGKRLSASELVAAAQGATVVKGTEVEAGTYLDPTGQVPGNWVLERRAGGSVYRQVGTGAIATPEQANALRKTGVQGTLSDQRAKLIQDMNIKLQGKTLEQQMTIQQDYNKLLVGQGFAPLQPNDTPLVAPQIAGGPTVAGAPAGAATMPAPGAPAAAPQPGAPRPALAPGAVAPTPLPAPGAPRPTASQIAATAEQQKQEAQEVGVDLGKVRTNFGKSKDAATRLINQAEELITDPGFSVSVGASIQPGFQFIPGSDRATWRAKHEEVVGQTFLTAIESLKGMGALSDKEGAAATAAISRLKNTDQNEESFKAAVRELQFIVKRGVDRNAEKLGREKPFGTTEPEVGTTGSSGGTTSSGNKYKKVQ